MRDKPLGLTAAFGTFHILFFKPGLPLLEQGMAGLTLILVNRHDEYYLLKYVTNGTLFTMAGREAAETLPPQAQIHAEVGPVPTDGSTNLTTTSLGFCGLGFLDCSLDGLLAALTPTVQFFLALMFLVTCHVCLLDISAR
jgi:hypothetical protein